MKILLKASATILFLVITVTAQKRHHLDAGVQIKIRAVGTPRVSPDGSESSTRSTTP